MLIRGDTTDDAKLLSTGDVIFVPSRSHWLPSMASFHRPAIYRNSKWNSSVAM